MISGHGTVETAVEAMRRAFADHPRSALAFATLAPISEPAIRTGADERGNRVTVAGQTTDAYPLRYVTPGDFERVLVPFGGNISRGGFGSDHGNRRPCAHARHQRQNGTGRNPGC